MEKGRRTKRFSKLTLLGIATQLNFACLPNEKTDKSNVTISSEVHSPTDTSYLMGYVKKLFPDISDIEAKTALEESSNNEGVMSLTIRALTGENLTVNMVQEETGRTPSEEHLADITAALSWIKTLQFEKATVAGYGTEYGLQNNDRVEEGGVYLTQMSPSRQRRLAVGAALIYAGFWFGIKPIIPVNSAPSDSSPAARYSHRSGR